MKPPHIHVTPTDELIAYAKAMDVARLQGRLEAFSMAITECSRVAKRDAGSVGARDCGEIRVAIDILHLHTLQQMVVLK